MVFASLVGADYCTGGRDPPPPLHDVGVKRHAGDIVQRSTPMGVPT